MSTQFVVVAYDIVDDRRRTRLHHLLEGYGTPVQYSVFECRLEPPLVKKMKKAVRRTIRRSQDQVRYYHLCAGCARRIEVEGVGAAALKDKEAIVV